MKKVQIPVVGGLRKMVRIAPPSSVGTTIAEFGNGTITLAQLRAALGVSGSTSTAGGKSSSGTIGTLAGGTGVPGLAGPVGPQGPQGPIGVVWNVGTADFGPIPVRSGLFFLEPPGGFTKIQVGKFVQVFQNGGSDEDQQAQAICTGVVVNTRQVKVQWVSANGAPIRGKRSISFLVQP